MVWAANTYTVFDDEALSCRLYATPMGKMVDSLWRGEDPDPPFYYLFQNMWVRVFGVGPFALRGMSILLFMMGLLIIRRAAELWFDRSAGIATILICALHPAHLFFGFAGRWYSMMFLLVAALLALSAKTGAAASNRLRPSRAIAWGLVAAAACYTNYFGPVMAGLIWLAAVIRDRRNQAYMRHHLLSAAVAAAIYAPWVPVFWHHVVHFPQIGGGLPAYASSAARLGMTILAGNLAGPSAWWVWVPMVLGMLVCLAMLLRDPGRFGVLAIILIGAITAGIASRTLIDKYVMIVSGPFCTLLGGILSGALRRGDAVKSNHRTRRLSIFAVAAMSLAWAGCMYDLMTQKHWSSMRWLDPFERVTRELYEQNWHHSYPDAVCSHPSARYYLALHRATDSHRSAIEKQIQPIGMLAPPKNSADWMAALRADATEWLACLNDQEAQDGGGAYFALLPSAMVGRLEAGDRPSLIITLETAGFVELPEWTALRTLLTKHYLEADEPTYHLEDDAAALKDRLDPAFNHPRWRITVRRFRLKE